MKKSGDRYVTIDTGYGPREKLERVKVIRSEETKGLFDDKPKEILLVEICGGERIWVAFWTETN